MHTGEVDVMLTRPGFWILFAYPAANKLMVYIVLWKSFQDLYIFVFQIFIKRRLQDRNFRKRTTHTPQGSEVFNRNPDFSCSEYDESQCEIERMTSGDLLILKCICTWNVCIRGDRSDVWSTEEMWDTYEITYETYVQLFLMYSRFSHDTLRDVKRDSISFFCVLDDFFFLRIMIPRCKRIHDFVTLRVRYRRLGVAYYIDVSRRDLGDVVEVFNT